MYRSSAARDATWLGRLSIKTGVDLKTKKKVDPKADTKKTLKDSSQLHEEKKGTVGPFTHIKDTFNAPGEEGPARRSHALNRPLR